MASLKNALSVLTTLRVVYGASGLPVLIHLPPLPGRSSFLVVLHQIVGLCSRRETSVVTVARLRMSIIGGRVPVRNPFKVRDEHHRPLPELHERRR
jgi:hypothetical protein